MITIKHYINLTEANLDKSFLESKGIKSYLKNEMIVGIDGNIGVGDMELELQVHPDHAKEALEILENK